MQSSDLNHILQSKVQHSSPIKHPVSNPNRETLSSVNKKKDHGLQSLAQVIKEGNQTQDKILGSQTIDTATFGGAQNNIGSNSLKQKISKNNIIKINQGQSQQSQNYIAYTNQMQNIQQQQNLVRAQRETRRLQIQTEVMRVGSISNQNTTTNTVNLKLTENTANHSNINIQATNLSVSKNNKNRERYRSIDEVNPPQNPKAQNGSAQNGNAKSLVGDKQAHQMLIKSSHKVQAALSGSPANIIIANSNQKSTAASKQEKFLILPNPSQNQPSNPSSSKQKELPKLSHPSGPSNATLHPSTSSTSKPNPSTQSSNQAPPQAVKKDRNIYIISNEVINASPAIDHTHVRMALPQLPMKKTVHSPDQQNVQISQHKNSQIIHLANQKERAQFNNSQFHSKDETTLPTYLGSPRVLGSTQGEALDNFTSSKKSKFVSKTSNGVIPQHGSSVQTVPLTKTNSKQDLPTFSNYQTSTLHNNNNQSFDVQINNIMAKNLKQQNQTSSQSSIKSVANPQNTTQSKIQMKTYDQSKPSSFSGQQNIGVKGSQSENNQYLQQQQLRNSNTQNVQGAVPNASNNNNSLLDQSLQQNKKIQYLFSNQGKVYELPMLKQNAQQPQAQSQINTNFNSNISPQKKRSKNIINQELIFTSNYNSSMGGNQDLKRLYQQNLMSGMHQQLGHSKQQSSYEFKESMQTLISPVNNKHSFDYSGQLNSVINFTEGTLSYGQRQPAATDKKSISVNTLKGQLQFNTSRNELANQMILDSSAIVDPQAFFNQVSQLQNSPNLQHPVPSSSNQTSSVKPLKQKIQQINNQLALQQNEASKARFKKYKNITMEMNNYHHHPEGARHFQNMTQKAASLRNVQVFPQVDKPMLSEKQCDDLSLMHNKLGVKRKAIENLLVISFDGVIGTYIRTRDSGNQAIRQSHQNNKQFIRAGSKSHLNNSVLSSQTSPKNISKPAPKNGQQNSPTSQNQNSSLRKSLNQNQQGKFQQNDQSQQQSSFSVIQQSPRANKEQGATSRNHQTGPKTHQSTVSKEQVFSNQSLYFRQGVEPALRNLKENFKIIIIIEGGDKYSKKKQKQVKKHLKRNKIAYDAVFAMQTHPLAFQQASNLHQKSGKQAQEGQSQQSAQNQINLTNQYHVSKLLEFANSKLDNTIFLTSFRPPTPQKLSDNHYEITSCATPLINQTFKVDNYGILPFNHKAKKMVILGVPDINASIQQNERGQMFSSDFNSVQQTITNFMNLAMGYRGFGVRSSQQSNGGILEINQQDNSLRSSQLQLKTPAKKVNLLSSQDITDQIKREQQLLNTSQLCNTIDKTSGANNFSQIKSIESGTNNQSQIIEQQTLQQFQLQHQQPDLFYKAFVKAKNHQLFSLTYNSNQMDEFIETCIKKRQKIYALDYSIKIYKIKKLMRRVNFLHQQDMLPHNMQNHFSSFGSSNNFSRDNHHGSIGGSGGHHLSSNQDIALSKKKEDGPFSQAQKYEIMRRQPHYQIYQKFNVQFYKQIYDECNVKYPCHPTRDQLQKLCQIYEKEMQEFNNIVQQSQENSAYNIMNLNGTLYTQKPLIFQQRVKQSNLYIKLMGCNSNMLPSQKPEVAKQNIVYINNTQCERVTDIISWLSKPQKPILESSYDVTPNAQDQLTSQPMGTTKGIIMPSSQLTHQQYKEQSLQQPVLSSQQFKSQKQSNSHQGGQILNNVNGLQGQQDNYQKAKDLIGSSIEKLGNYASTVLL